MKKSFIILAFMLLAQMAFAQHLELKADVLLMFFNTASLGLEMNIDETRTTYQLEVQYMRDVEAYRINSSSPACLGCGIFEETPHPINMMVLVPSVRHYMTRGRWGDSGWYISAYLRSDIVFLGKNDKKGIYNISIYDNQYDPQRSDLFFRNALGGAMGNKWALTPNMFFEVGAGFDIDASWGDSIWDDFGFLPTCKLSFRLK